MIHMLKILVDADDVLENLCEVWVGELNRIYGTSVELCNIKEWDMQLVFPQLTREEIYAPINDDSFWDKLKPIDGSQAALEHFQENGHEVFIVTATDPRYSKHKIEVLLNMFPTIDIDHIILTHIKQMVNGDVLIDDGIHNLIGGNYKKILVDRPHNRNIDDTAYGIYRVKSWTEIEEIINRMSYFVLNDMVKEASKENICLAFRMCENNARFNVDICFSHVNDVKGLYYDMLLDNYNECSIHRLNYSGGILTIEINNSINPNNSSMRSVMTARVANSDGNCGKRTNMILIDKNIETEIIDRIILPELVEYRPFHIWSNYQYNRNS